MFYYDYYSLVLIFPLIIFSLIVQVKMQSTYSKYAKVQNSRMMTGADMARTILQNGGVLDVTVECIQGKLSDHFDPSKKVIRLSEEVYNGMSVSAIGVAAHEAGHALQYAKKYAPMYLRSAVVGITSFSSRILYFVIILSFIIAMPILTDIAVVCFVIIFLFQLITLPVEFNASRRAIQNISGAQFSEDDVRGVKRVLSSAAMTYVAAMLISLGQLMAFLARSRRD